jgi:hypothetical protein
MPFWTSCGSRKRSEGLHVDANWYEYGDLPYDIHADIELGHACVAASARAGVHARGVNYDHFPLDTGTIVACDMLRIGTPERPLALASNNLYHDAATSESSAPWRCVAPMNWANGLPWLPLAISRVVSFVRKSICPVIALDGWRTTVGISAFSD